MQIASQKVTNKHPQQTGRKAERRLNTPLLPLLTGIFAVLYALTGYHGWLGVGQRDGELPGRARQRAAALRPSMTSRKLCS